MQRRTRPTRPALLALGLGLCTIAPVNGASQVPVLAGLWRYNAEASERPDDRRPVSGSRGGFPAGPRGSPRGSGMGGRPRSGGGSPETSAQVMAFLRPVLQILIQQDDSTVSLSDASGQMQTIRTDGRKVTETSLTGEELETTARWKDSRLTVERKFGGAGSVREVYSIEPLSRKLLVEVRVDGRMFPKAVEMRRIYDPANGS